MKSVLCYGDSNTFGSIPGQPGARYGYDDRWPSALQSKLGPEWHVIPEGLPGRTTCRDDPVEGAHLNGRTYLRPCLESHLPLDVIVIMLGTNDLKARFHSSAHEIASGMGALVDDIREIAVRKSRPVPEIIVMSPPPVRRDLGVWAKVLDGAYEKAQHLAGEFAAMADAKQVRFIDAGKFTPCSPCDGFHIDSSGAKALGAGVAGFLGT